MSDNLYLIPLLPLAGFLINGLFLRYMPRRFVSLIACGTVGLSFLVSLFLFLELKGLPAEFRVIRQVLFSWIPSGDFQADMGLLLDPLSAVMILVVTGVGFLIHVYSVGYMAHDHGYGRYFAYLNLFTFSMLVLVLADNFLFMFVGWEGVGLCSYLLIGFWFEKKSAADAGKKAFIVNRIGDFGFLIGMFIIFWQLGSLDFMIVAERAPEVFLAGGTVVTTVCILLFVGAVGKSAQIPLYVWLPDAMEGPTPVSALIHAATMVTAGVYMIARSNALYILAPEALLVVAIVGAATALYAATIGLVQNDIKRVLAYSTVSQLGYMFMACGVAAFTAGVFHLITHAFFKALLFLGAGSVIHAMSNQQDMRFMGGLKKYLPLTYLTFFIATLAISGIPLMSGFFSKDEILWKIFSSEYGHTAFWVIGVVTAALTAFYMFRLLYLTFYGHERMDEKTKSHLHESPRVMTVPLMILAVLSIIGGWIGLPHIFGVTNFFEEWLAPVMAAGGTHHKLASPMLAASAESGSIELLLMLGTLAVVGVAIFAAYRVYRLKPELADSLASKMSGAYRLLLNKYYVDEIYGVLVVRPIVYLSVFFWKIMDVLFIDGLINGLAKLYEGVSESLRIYQTGRIRSYATAFALGVALLIAYVVLA